MAIRGKRALGVAKSLDAGVVALVLYWAASKNPDGSDAVLTNEGDTPSESVRIDVPPVLTVNGEEMYVINLEDIPEVTALPEGEYDFGAAYEDAAGNVSDIQEAEDVTIDLTPPEKPTKVVVISAP